MDYIFFVYVIDLIIIDVDIEFYLLQTCYIFVNVER